MGGVVCWMEAETHDDVELKIWTMPTVLVVK
jgi:hypothetical protein